MSKNHLDLSRPTRADLIARLAPRQTVRRTGKPGRARAGRRDETAIMAVCVAF